MLVVSFVAGLYLWFHESVAAIQAHSQDVKSAQKFLGEPPAPGHAAIGAGDRLRPPRERGSEHALAVGHGDADPHRPGDEDGLDDVLPPRPDRQRPLPGTAGLLREDQLGLRGLRREGNRADGQRHDRPADQLPDHGQLPRVQADRQHGSAGVWIDVDRRYFNDNAGLSPTFGYAKINLQPGYQLLTGGSALDYVRYRHTDSDLFRVARQQQFVKAMKYQFKHNFSVLKVPKIVGTLTKNIEVARGRRRRRLGPHDPQLRVLRVPPAAGPLLPDADPGADRLLRPPHRPRRTSPPPSRTGRRPTSTAAQVATAVALGRKVEAADADPARRRRSPS